MNTKGSGMIEQISQLQTAERSEPGTKGSQSYTEHVNPQWVRLLQLLQMDARYTRCQGVVLQTENGDRILDFLSGYCVHNIGHNHPAIISALHEELDSCG